MFSLPHAACSRTKLNMNEASLNVCIRKVHDVIGEFAVTLYIEACSPQGTLSFALLHIDVAKNSSYGPRSSQTWVGQNVDMG